MSAGFQGAVCRSLATWCSFVAISILVCVFDISSHCVAQAGLELLILLPVPLSVGIIGKVSPLLAICIPFFFLQYWGFELRALTLARQALYHLRHFTSPLLCWVF
jgi:hypothetical protein